MSLAVESDPFAVVWVTWTQEKTRRYVQRAVSKFWQEGNIYEMRQIDAEGRITSGYYDDVQAFARDAAASDGKRNVYWIPNPLRPDIAADYKAPLNRLRDKAYPATRDADVLHRCILLVDIDPIRPDGLSDYCASHAEHCEALALQGRIASHLAGAGWDTPLYEMDSGNGAYILIPVDMPNDDMTRELFKACLVALAQDFDCKAAHVDTSTYNAARLVRVPGLLNCKVAWPGRERRRAFLTVWPKEARA